MSGDAASAMLFVFAVHCVFVYALVRGLTPDPPQTGERPSGPGWHVPTPPGGVFTPVHSETRKTQDP